MYEKPERFRNLGPKKTYTNETGKIINDEKIVLDKWCKDFKHLYNGSDSDDFDQGHFEQVRAHKHSLESRMDYPTYSANETLNRNILFDEINRLVFKAKSKSASGYDEIPFGVLKFQKVIEKLMGLFQFLILVSFQQSYARFLKTSYQIIELHWTIDEFVSSPLKKKDRVKITYSRWILLFETQNHCSWRSSTYGNISLTGKCCCTNW